LTYRICSAIARVVLFHLFLPMSLAISPTFYEIQTLHDEFMAAISQVQSVYDSIQAAYDQLSAIESGHSWLIDHGIPTPPTPELNIIEGNLVFSRRHLTCLIEFGYQMLDGLKERFDEMRSEPL
jgi:hypothetical protein